ncbi:hypothetical protein ABZ725_14605 [Streptomyces sp. NPDC006872]|uniref:hypothetical protein n=1 Tax=Streptomyces sp. NPDC006872 TaxID=3155720 RepID=UPI0033D2F777
MAANPRPAARKTAARAQSRPRVPEPDVTEAEAQEIEAEGHYVTVELCGEDLRIIPPAAWRLSYQRLLNAGQVDAFIERVLHPDDVDLFVELDCTGAEFQQFIVDAGEQGGESLGKSPARSRSGKTMRRR